MSDGLITVESRFPVSETIDRSAAAAIATGLLVFARIDHHKGASSLAAAVTGGLTPGLRRRYTGTGHVLRKAQLRVRAIAEILAPPSSR